MDDCKDCEFKVELFEKGFSGDVFFGCLFMSCFHGFFRCSMTDPTYCWQNINEERNFRTSEEAFTDLYAGLQT